MIKNLETADTIVKLILAGLVILLFVFNIIAGPFAILLVILSAGILLLSALRLLYRRLFPPRKR